MVISDPLHTECSNLTETRWAKYICNHENNMPSYLSLQWFCGNSCTWAHDVQLCHTSCDQVHELPQSHCGDNWKGTLFL